ncbi:hypothetical protein QYE76_010924 [Lolium multiflorum]|uniref:non-specific serine/threonine protein kinase n=1 Tax=Lolium multiflorum TaxID=4521 RepID=A0AAD8TY70_LOLMU|nr:hypothetical protein QYE76_010924 [Lolium multiflorum]
MPKNGTVTDRVDEEVDDLKAGEHEEEDNGWRMDGYGDAVATRLWHRAYEAVAKSQFMARLASGHRRFAGDDPPQSGRLLAGVNRLSPPLCRRRRSPPWPIPETKTRRKARRGGLRFDSSMTTANFPKNGKPVLRKMEDGRMFNWNVRSVDPGCNLQEALEKRLGVKRGATEIKQHPFSEGVHWAFIRCSTPPEVPRPVESELPMKYRMSVAIANNSKRAVGMNTKPGGKYLDF